MVYDCFTFFNEYELLELRLKTLYNVVDYFVIVESNKTHHNVPKPYNFAENITRYEDYWEKIIYVKEADVIPYSGGKDFSLENHQRNCIMMGLRDAQPDDYIFISDVDELWAPDLLEKIKQETAICKVAFPIPGSKNVNLETSITAPAKGILEYAPLVLEQQLHMYYMNYLANMKWTGTILTKFKNLQMHSPQKFRDLRFDLIKIQNGGWHFSYMGGADAIIQKMNSIVEGVQEYANKKHAELLMKTGLDPLLRTKAYRCQPCSIEAIELPAIHYFHQKYPHFFYQG